MWNPDKTEISELHGKYGTVIGWGTTEISSMSNVLRQASMPVVNHWDCISSNRLAYGSLLSNTSFCAGSRNGSFD